MDFNSAIDIIIKDLEEARAIIDDLKKLPGVPRLQVELAKSKCRSAAEVMELLKTAQNNDSKLPVPETRESQPPDQTGSRIKPVWAVQPDPVVEPEPEIKPETAKTEKNGTPPEESPLAVKKNEAASGRVENPKIEIIKNEPEDVYGHGILADKFSLDNESSYPSPSRPATLTEAIGINDKFLFIREIFDNNRELYTQVITKLENVSSIDDARSLIMSYTRGESSMPAAKLLLDLVKRKLSSDE